MQCSPPVDRKPDCLTLEGGLGAKLIKTKTSKVFECLQGPWELSAVLYWGLFGSGVVTMIFCSVAVPRCHPGPGHGQGSAQLSQDTGGLF